MCRALYMQMTEKGEIPAFSRLRDRIEVHQAAGLQDCRMGCTQGWKLGKRYGHLDTLLLPEGRWASAS